MKGGGG